MDISVQSVAWLPHGLLLLTKLKKLRNFASLHRINLTWLWRQHTPDQPWHKLFLLVPPLTLGKDFASRNIFSFNIGKVKRVSRSDLNF